MSMLSLFFLFFLTARQSWVNCAFHHDLYRTADLTLFNDQVLFLYEHISFIGPFNTGLAGAGEVTLHLFFSLEILQKVFCSIEINWVFLFSFLGSVDLFRYI